MARYLDPCIYDVERIAASVIEQDDGSLAVNLKMTGGEHAGEYEEGARVALLFAPKFSAYGAAIAAAIEAVPASSEEAAR